MKRDLFESYVEWSGGVDLIEVSQLTVSIGLLWPFAPFVATIFVIRFPYLGYMTEWVTV